MASESSMKIWTSKVSGSGIAKVAKRPFFLSRFLVVRTRTASHSGGSASSATELNFCVAVSTSNFWSITCVFVMGFVLPPE